MENFPNFDSIQAVRDIRPDSYNETATTPSAAILPPTLIQEI